MSLRCQGLCNPLAESMAKSEASGLISVSPKRRMNIEKKEKKTQVIICSKCQNYWGDKLKNIIL